jgi:uncharacterized tellurite resistance protein B-like protein
MREHIETITDLLMGAAYADKRVQAAETTAIERALCSLLGSEQLPTEQADQIRRFNPAKFSLDEAAKPFSGEPLAVKRKVLELIASVNDADDVLDFDENNYLSRVAAAMGMTRAEIREFVLEFEEG